MRLRCARYRVADRGVVPPRLFVDIPAQVTQEHTSSSTQIMRSSGRDERQKSPIRYSGTASLSHHTAFSHDYNTRIAMMRHMILVNRIWVIHVRGLFASSHNPMPSLAFMRGTTHHPHNGYCTQTFLSSFNLNAIVLSSTFVE